MILDNAFLMHRPGIKTKTDNLNQIQKNKVAAQNTLVRFLKNMAFIVKILNF